MSLTIKEIPISKIKIPSNKTREIDQEKVIELAESIDEVGLLQPILVDKKNNLIAGQHRVNLEIPFKVGLL